MTMTIRDLVSYRLAMLASRNDRSGQAHLKETFGLTLGAWRVLGNIAADEPVAFVTLSMRMVMDKGQLSRTVAALTAQGLILPVLDPQDRRNMSLKLTRTGRDLHDRVITFVADRNDAVASVLTAPERRALQRILAKLECFIVAEHTALAHGNARDAEAVARSASRAAQRKPRHSKSKTRLHDARTMP